jgi:putative glutathione S-transferase
MTKNNENLFGYKISDGEFVRDEVNFRNWVSTDGKGPFPVESGRYHLYVSLACPWSHRAVLLRSIRKLESVISISVTDPIWNEKGWCFGTEPGAIPDSVNHKQNVIDLYQMVDPNFNKPETVPILWDKKTSTIVNNESRDIMRIFDLEFSKFGDPSISLCPENKKQEIDRVISEIYDPINNGVYKAGFSQSQKAYERAVKRLFEALEKWEIQLSQQRYVCGDQMTEADIALFVTLIRFDFVYVTHFKCNIKRLVDFPNLWGWLRDVYQSPGVAKTCDFNHIKKHYFGSHKEINPTGIIPVGPILDLWKSHDRDRF